MRDKAGMDTIGKGRSLDVTRDHSSTRREGKQGLPSFSLPRWGRGWEGRPLVTGDRAGHVTGGGQLSRDGAGRVPVGAAKRCNHPATYQRAIAGVGGLVGSWDPQRRAKGNNERLLDLDLPRILISTFIRDLIP